MTCNRPSCDLGRPHTHGDQIAGPVPIASAHRTATLSRLDGHQGWCAAHDWLGPQRKTVDEAHRDIDHHIEGPMITGPVPYAEGGYISGPPKPACSDGAHLPERWEHVIKIRPLRLGPAELQMCTACWRIVNSRPCEHTPAEQAQILHDALTQTGPDHA